MATFWLLVIVSKTKIRSREFSFSSRCLRLKIINLDLVSMPEIGGDFFSVLSWSLRLSVRNSRSCLDVRDWIRETLLLVSIMKKWLSLTSGSYPYNSLRSDIHDQRFMQHHIEYNPSSRHVSMPLIWFLNIILEVRSSKSLQIWSKNLKTFWAS